MCVSPHIAADSRIPAQRKYNPKTVLSTQSGDCCRHCRASLSAWNQIADHLGHGTGVQIIGISTDSILPTQSLVAEHEMRFPVVSMVDPKLRALYRSRVVPQTLLLDANGIITYARLGAVEGIVAIDSIMVQVDLAIGRATTGSNRAVAMPESG